MSLIALGLWAAFAQTDVPDAPVPPLGSSATFQESVKATAELLESGEFEAAAKRAATLPRSKFVIKLDPEGLDKIEADIAKTALNVAIDKWKTEMPELEIATSGKPDVVIGFTKEVMPLPGEPINALTMFYSPDPAEPNYEFVLATVRTEKKLAIEQPVYESEIGFMIGTFLGLERQPKPNSAMFRTDGVSARLLRPDFPLIRQARENIKVADTLREAAKEKKRLAARYPQAFIDTDSLSFGTVPQGEYQTLQFQVHNRGRAPLKFEIRPDCSCFRFSYQPEVAPGESSVVSIVMSTTDFQGDQDKGLFIYTNDPGKPVQRIGVTGTILPAYRLISGGEDKTVAVDESGAKLTYYFFSPAGTDIKPLRATLSGVTGVATISPWSGSLADPQFDEPAKERTGYKVEVMIAPSVKGRQLVALMVQTDSKVFPVVAANFYAQRGVAASPESIYFGDVPTGKTRGFTLLYGTNPDFKVLGVEAKPGFVTAEATQVSPGEWKISVTVDAKPGTGTLLASVIVKTNDPVTPEIIIPVQGYVP